MKNLYIENIVIGSPLFSYKELLSKNESDWENVEKEKTIATNERFLPKILVEIGATKSTSEIRRNRPDLVRVLNEPDFLFIKLGKKKFWIVVGE